MSRSSIHRQKNGDKRMALFSCPHSSVDQIPLLVKYLLLEKTDRKQAAVQYWYDLLPPNANYP